MDDCLSFSILEEEEEEEEESGGGEDRVWKIKRTKMDDCLSFNIIEEEEEEEEERVDEEGGEKLLEGILTKDLL